MSGKNDNLDRAAHALCRIANGEQGCSCATRLNTRSASGACDSMRHGVTAVLSALGIDHEKIHLITSGEARISRAPAPGTRKKPR